MNDTTAGRIVIGDGVGATWGRPAVLPSRIRRADVRVAAPVSPTAPTVPAGKMPTQHGAAPNPSSGDYGSKPPAKSPAPIIAGIVALVVLGGGYFVWSSRQAPAGGVMNGQPVATPAVEAHRPLDPRGIGNLNDLTASPGAGPAGALSSLVPTPPPTPVPVETPRVRREETAERPQPHATPKAEARAEQPAEPERPKREETHSRTVLDPSRSVKSAIEHQQKTHDVSDETNPLGIPGE